MSAEASPPTKYGVVVFPAFQALDVFGPMDVLNTLNLQEARFPQAGKLSLSILSSTLDPVSTKPLDASLGQNFSQSIVPTNTFDSAPCDLEVLLVPGGLGTRSEENIKPAMEFIKRVFPKLRYLITVCTGSALVAKTGILDGRKATTNKKSWNWVVEQGPNVDWVGEARWTVDGNIWTSSGVSAGIDIMFAFVAAMYGTEIAKWVADSIEYERHVDASWDPFWDLWNPAVQTCAK